MEEEWATHLHPHQATDLLPGIQVEHPLLPTTHPNRQTRCTGSRDPYPSRVTVAAWGPAVRHGEWDNMGLCIVHPCE
jgi:hypothetical protein